MFCYGFQSERHFSAVFKANQNNQKTFLSNCAIKKLVFISKFVKNSLEQCSFNLLDSLFLNWTDHRPSRKP